MDISLTLVKSTLVDGICLDALQHGVTPPPLFQNVSSTIVSKGSLEWASAKPASAKATMCQSLDGPSAVVVEVARKKSASGKVVCRSLATMLFVFQNQQRGYQSKRSMTRKHVPFWKAKDSQCYL